MPAGDTPFRILSVVTSASQDPADLLRLDPASTFTAAARDVASYLSHFGCMADHDEDMHASHWIENSSFPMGILRKLILQAAPDSSEVDSAIGITPPNAPIVLKRASSTAPSDSYDVACVVLGPELGPDCSLWPALERLRLTLTLKERVHQQYVRIGTRAKLQVRLRSPVRKALLSLYDRLFCA